MESSLKNTSQDAIKEKMVWTIGHSTHSLDAFVAMLQSFNIDLVVDVRSFPGSRKFPHFNKDALEISLPANKLEYLSLPSLGGRRKAASDSHNTSWHHPAFRGYADYMETAVFKDGFQQLKNLASNQRVAYMCSEAVWWRCHRSMISDALKSEGWTVMHIMALGKAKEHPYTQPAGTVDGKLSYTEDAKPLRPG